MSDPRVLRLPSGFLKVAAYKERRNAKEIGVMLKLELPSPPYPPEHSIQMDLDMAQWRKLVQSVEAQIEDVRRGNVATVKESGF